MVKKRGDRWYLYFYPYGSQKKVGISLPVQSKTEAKAIEALLSRAFKYRDFSSLDAISLDVVRRVHKNQGWEMPEAITPAVPKQELTLWGAAELFLKAPEINKSKSRWRHEIALNNIMDHFGPDYPAKKIWVTQIKEYQQSRLDKDISPATVNREVATLSGLFRVLVESQRLEVNPVRHIKSLSTKADQREVYLSKALVMEVIDHAPGWFRSVILSAYYTGMRLGELRTLTRDKVKLGRRMIYLSPDDTKEGQEKRVPIHRDLGPILEQAMKVRRLDSNRLFLIAGRDGLREPSEDSFKKPWARAYKALELPKPWPTFHDLRHTWKTNARRSGMDSEIRESILGHWFKEKSVTERYGRISDQELVNAIDSMTFDHGESEIYVPKAGPPVNPDQLVTFGKQNQEKRKKAVGLHDLTT